MTCRPPGKLPNSQVGDSRRHIAAARHWPLSDGSMFDLGELATDNSFCPQRALVRRWEYWNVSPMPVVVSEFGNSKDGLRPCMSHETGKAIDHELTYSRRAILGQTCGLVS